MNKIQNLKVVVTGATSGIGKSLTLKLLDLGAKVAFCGRNQNKMESLIKSIDSNKQQYYFDTFDISNEEKIIDFVYDSSNKFGELNVLVNCAGVNSSRAPISELKTDDLEWMLKINFIAPFIFMREVYNKMSLDTPGIFINVLSTACNFSNEKLGAYTSSKSGFDALCKIFRKEVRDKNKKVCSIYPGGVDTPFRSESRPNYLKAETVANAIISMMTQDDDTSVDELVVRPLVEKNYV